MEKSYRLIDFAISLVYYVLLSVFAVAQFFELLLNFSGRIHIYIELFRYSIGQMILGILRRSTLDTLHY